MSLKNLNQLGVKEISKKELLITNGGKWVKQYITREDNLAGLPVGLYIINTETGAWYNVLGQQVLI